MKNKIYLRILFFVISLFLVNCTKRNLEDIDTIPPSVLSVSPSHNSDSVGLFVKIKANFSKPVDPESINSFTFSLRKSEMPINSGIAATTSCSENVASLYPVDILSPNTLYVVTITTGVKDTSGNSMISDYTWIFRTHGQLDLTPPSVISVLPSENATLVSLDVNPTIIFSEVVYPRTINSTTFKMKIEGLTIGSAVDCNISCLGNTAILNPKYDLAPNFIYRVTATSAITDTSGNRMNSDYSWIFTTVPRKSFSSDVVPIVNDKSISRTEGTLLTWLKQGSKKSFSNASIFTF